MVFSTFGLGFFFVIASYIKKASLPPSSAGRGSKLTKPMLTLKKAARDKIDNKPDETVDVNNW